MRIAITGASGFLGRELIPRLRAAGHSLLLVGRSADRLTKDFPDVPACGYDTLKTHLADMDAVIHTAVLNNDAAADAAQFHAVNVELLRDVAAQASRQGVPLFINITTLQALEPPFRTFYAQSKHMGEAALAAQEGLVGVNLRLPAVYGARFRGKLSILNGLPAALRHISFSALAALRPTVHFDRLFVSLEQVLADPPTASADILVTDGQGQNSFYRLFNRIIDYGFALTVILLLWWLCLAAWLLIRLTSPGPAIFAQPRIGREGRIFTCYKFRTMRSGTRQVATHEMTADVVTSVGKFMRRTKVDELPQAWNIFCGDMSLIGPRPCLPSQQALVDWRTRLGVLQVRPGITGLAQVRGVDMSDPERLTRLDAEYIARRSVFLDLRIVLATARGSGSRDYVTKS